MSDVPRTTADVFHFFIKKDQQWLGFYFYEGRPPCQISLSNSQKPRCKNDSGAECYSLGFSKSPIHWTIIVGNRYTCHIFSREQKVLQTHAAHKTTLSYGITYLVLVRYSSPYLLVLLWTTNKTGGGRATAGERQRASDVILCAQQAAAYYLQQ